MKYIVKQSDIGKGFMSVTKHEESASWIYPFQPLGRVQPRDVGKMLVKVGDIWQAENDEQFKKRTGKS